ncbi:MAG: ribonuclease G, partial [Paracoccaceae bacterium]
MKGSVVALDHVNGRAAAALIIDGRLEDFLIDGGADGPPRPGAVFRAVCDRPLKGQGAVMLRLPDAHGYLRNASDLRPGQAVLVQVTGYAEPGKAVPLSARVLFKSRYAIITPDAPGINVSRAIRDQDERVRLLEIADAPMGATPDAGLILRSSCARAGADDIS